MRLLFKKIFFYFKHQEKYDSVKLSDICFFLRQFTSLLTSNIPIIQTCELLEKTQIKKPLQIFTYKIRRDILSGKNLSQCFKMHSKYFGELSCNLVEIGEKTGKLELMFETITEYHEKNLALRKKLQLALFYPAMISGIALIVLLTMFLFIIPQFADLFAQSTTQLPLFTHMIFSTSSLIAAHPLLICGLTLIIFFIAIEEFRSITEISSQQRKLMPLMRRIPFWSQFLLKIQLSRFCRNLALTIHAGLALQQALQLAGNATPDRSFLSILSVLRHRISAGISLHQAMSSVSNYFPPFMIHMIKIGEESGCLEKMLNKLADFLEEEVNQFIRYLTQLLEPLIMIVLGVVIGALIIGMYLPVFKLGTVL